MQIGENDQVGTQEAELGGNRLLDLEHHVSLAPGQSADGMIRAPAARYARSSRRLPNPALCSISTVWPPAAQRADAGRRQRDAVFIGLDFAWNSYNHFGFTIQQPSAAALEYFRLNRSVGTFDGIGKRLKFSADGSRIVRLCNAISPRQARVSRE